MTGLRGQLDVVTSGGYVEGWAFDGGDVLRPLAVAVVAGGEEVARGLANLYRWDLAGAGCGTGWCAFRLSLSGPAEALEGAALSLCEAGSSAVLFTLPTVAVKPQPEPPLADLRDVARGDPTIVSAIAQLSGCGAVFAAFIEDRGIEAFVRYAYRYILGRPPDASGLASYCALLREEALSPYGVLQALSDSDEFRAEDRPLAAPPERGFPFRRP